MNNLGIVAFIGIGLIGGSLAKALKKVNAVKKIVAVDQSKAALAEALALGVIDEAIEFDALITADIIIISTPVAAFNEITKRLATLNLKENVVISDVGSTKTSVLSAMREAFGEIPSNFVPAHPIAGREYSGVAAAEESLFENHKVILTTLENTENRALGVISRVWHTAGAHITYMDIDKHDEILGATSHLPHLLAFLLVDMLNQDLHHQEIFSYAAGGFRDFTRIASSNPVMWRDIAVNNSQALLPLLETYKQRISELQNLIADGNAPKIEEIFARAKSARDNHYNKNI